MSDKQQAPATTAPVLLSEDEKGSLLTALSVLDTEVDRLLRLAGAREEVTRFTASARQLLERVETLPQQLHRQSAGLSMEIAKAESALTALHERKAREQRDHDALLAKLQREAQAARQAHEAEVGQLKAERQALAEERAALKQDFEQERAEMEATLKVLRADIAQAEDLRERLTSLRGA
jgi:chromosome segregation ATPase